MDPRLFYWMFLAALSLSGSGCGAGAAPAVNDVTDAAANRDAAELFRQGQRAAEQGDTVRAEQYLSMAHDRGFDASKLLPSMLRVCLSSSRLRAALNHAEPYLREHPNDRSLRYLVATIHLGLGQLDDARIDLNHLVSNDSNDANAYYLLGVLESGANVQVALAHFRRYLELAPRGEHAVEVQSRLKDLSVRIDLYRSRVLPESTRAQQVEPAIASPFAPKTQPMEVADWFDDPVRSNGAAP
jgi:tetratricopeptide (TPR) repeat protein